MEKEIISKVEEIIEEAEKMRGAYFFSAPSSAGSRRSYERYHSHPIVSWAEGGHEYTAEYTVSCSCHNVYASGTYTKDGVKTTLTAIKNSYKRMIETRDTVETIKAARDAGKITTDEAIDMVIEATTYTAVEED